MRLKVAHGGVERLHLRACHIGRIRDDQVKRSQEFLRGLFYVDGQALDPRGELQVLCVATRHTQRRLRHVAQRHAGVLDALGDRKADAAAACTQIQNARILLQKQRLFDGQLGHDVGIVPRDEHVGRDGQGHVVKIPLAEDVGHRLALEIALDEGFGQLADLLRGVQLAVGDHLLGRLAGGRADQLTGDVGGKLALLRQQGLARIQIQIRVLFYHLSLPSCSGSTRVSASMPTSIMESSGSFVVKYCSHIPGAESACVSQLS